MHIMVYYYSSETNFFQFVASKKVVVPLMKGIICIVK